MSEIAASIHIGFATLEIIVSDITTLSVDAIVNAANTSLLGGGGVDGAIHRKAGHELAMECRMLNGCKPGDAKMTKGYKLPAAHIIHTVGPVWQGGAKGEEDVLASCYRRSIETASKASLTSIAFPAISTGIYKFPPDRAAKIAVATVSSLVEESSLQLVLFCCFNQTAAASYSTAFSEYR
ncbi:MAG: O-acetyl-ADP-ribose deacetylase [Rhizobiaceae bacterium]